MKITKPTLLIDEIKVEKNIIKMKSKAETNNLIFRPHFKTHQSAEVGKIFKDNGITKITVSSVDMAKYFAKNGFRDILIAFPVNILEIDQINDLAAKVKLSLLVESSQTAGFISKKIEYPTNIYIKIDTGYHRTGLELQDKIEIRDIIEICDSSQKLNFVGILTHSGQTYKAKSISEINEIHDKSRKVLNEIADYSGRSMLISIGDTPSCTICEDFNGVDEIRPGNFAYYDLMQQNLGVCSYEEIAVALAAPVVAKHKSRNEIVVFGGGVHLSKEFILKEDKPIFGKVVLLNEDLSWNHPISQTFVKSLSQEHGIISTTDDVFQKIKIGQLVGILPIHSCLTANLMRENSKLV